MGRTGFATVARNRQIPEKLAMLVERCALYENHTGEVKPVAYSSRSVVFFGRTYFVLTRTCDSGVDYTGRNNYLAHHLVVCEDEIKPDGPSSAEVLLNWDGWKSSWNESPHYIDDTIDISSIPRIPHLVPCQTWKEVFGSAQDAAILNDKNSSVLVAKAGQEELVLRLFAESMALILNPMKRWGVSFTTYQSEGHARFNWLWKTYIEPQTIPERAINVITGTMPIDDTPASRAAEYALSGVLTNKERNNLFAASPQSRPVRTFEVMPPPPPRVKDIRRLKLAMSVVGLLAAVLFFYLFFVDKKVVETSDDVPVASESESATFKSIENAPNLSFTQVKSRIRDLIDELKFQDAVAFWKASNKTNLDPSYERKLISDIGIKMDAIANEAGVIFDREPLSKEDEDKAIELLRKYEAGLSIENLPRMGDRLKRLETLKTLYLNDKTRAK